MENDLLWTMNIKNILDTNGMSSFYINNHDDKPFFVQKRLFLRLCDQFHQNVLSEINNKKSKLRTYALLKQEPGFESYLHDTTNPKIRKTYSKFRLSNHNLNIEKGRHIKTEDEAEKLQNRLCPFCQTLVESEIHFDCPKYSKTFANQYCTLNTPFATYSSEERFIYLLLSPE